MPQLTNTRSLIALGSSRTWLTNATMRSRLRSVVRQVESAWYHPDLQRPWIGPAVKAALAMCATARPDAIARSRAQPAHVERVMQNGRL